MCSSDLSSIRLDIRRVGTIKQGEDAIGNRTRVKVVKNKLAPPFRVCEFDVLFGQGISKTGEILDLGAECGAVEKSGAWFSAHGERLGQGRENARAFLAENRELAATLEKEIRVAHGVDQPAPVTEAASAEDEDAGEDKPKRTRARPN